MNSLSLLVSLCAAALSTSSVISITGTVTLVTPTISDYQSKVSPGRGNWNYLVTAACHWIVSFQEFMMQDHILADLSITLYGHRTLLFVYGRIINLCLDSMLAASGALVLTCSQCDHCHYRLQTLQYRMLCWCRVDSAAETGQSTCVQYRVQCTV